MHVSRLSLNNYRNYDSLELELPAGLIVLQGSNAQGKTNLLEAIYYVATSRSPRTTTDHDLIAREVRDDYPEATRVAAQVEAREGSLVLEIMLMAAPRGVRKQIRINRAPRRALDLLGALRVVLFRPEDIELIGGAPSERRRTMDILLSQIEPGYARVLQRYNRVLLQRNHLLRRIDDGQAGTDQLPPWDRPLAAHGAQILAARYQALASMSVLACESYRQLSGTDEEVQIQYRGTLDRDGGAGDTAALEALFQARLHASQRREVALGQTVVGPHRDDLEFRIAGAPAAGFGSRGQQRTAVLAWKLAETRYLRQQTGEDPVVLLDDVLSELDAVRRAGVLRAAAGYQQVLLTTTGAELGGTQLSPAALFRVQAGQVLRS